MYNYVLRMKKDGRNVSVSESRSPFPPDSEGGRKAILNAYKLGKVANLPGACAVSLLSRDGKTTWFNRQGQPVDEESAFRG